MAGRSRLCAERVGVAVTGRHGRSRALRDVLAPARGGLATGPALFPRSARDWRRCADSGPPALRGDAPLSKGTHPLPASSVQTRRKPASSDAVGLDTLRRCLELPVSFGLVCL